MEELKQEQMQEQEESVEEKPTTNEEKATRTYTQEEVNEIKKNAIAEGMRKASKQQANQNNDELEKLNASLNEKDNLIAVKEKMLEEVDNKMNELNAELTAIKQVKKMDDLGIDKKYQEDVIALIKGHGDEVNEETISLIAENHPEWKVDAEIGIGQLGQTRPQSNPYDEAQAREQKEIKEKFRL